MTWIRRALALSTLAGAALVAVPLSASAQDAPPDQNATVAADDAARHGSAATIGAVYVLSNRPAGNTVIRYDRMHDGSLVAAGEYPTGGAGTGGGLMSQGAVTIDDAGRYLYAVNAGSASVTSFRIRRDGLELIDTAPSGGATPTSVTVHGDLVYVLNAGDPGSISGFSVRNGDLTPLAGSTRPLSAAGTQPGEVAFTPDGDRLVVSERAMQRFDVYAINRRGLPVGPTLVASSGVTPYGFAFDQRGHAIVSEAMGGMADASAVSSYDLRRGGFSVVSPSVPTTETSACWIAITPDGRFAYSGNAASQSITGYAIGRKGDLTILTADGKTASGHAGVTDLATSSDGRWLYARMGDGTVGAWTIERDGSLVEVGAFAGLPAGAAGIAAI
jgi:6-phosphogluconolactonase (cycloisomerase 2 family)